MKISDILDFMGLIGVGTDVLTDSDKAIYLQYINQAHYELYNYTAALNEDLLISEEKTTTANIGDVDLSNRPLSVNTVYVDGYIKPLTQKRRMEFVDYTKQSISPGSPCIFTFRLKKLSIYPIMKDITYDLDIWYTPENTDLAENTPEDDIPYPPSFHYVLREGALYYLFQDEGGFKNPEKVTNQLAKWEKGKQDLYGYLFHKTGDIVSTFSNV
jgi:hypothetical protein